uniref:hypothetical protein n=1 Tax=Flavobacterium sp. TaxID=239 RepID=UPI004049C991
MNSNHKWKLIEGHEEWKIFPSHRVFYFECIKSSAESAISSWEKLNKIVSSHELFKKEGIKLIDLSENIVNQSAIISRYFFPSRDNRNVEKDKIHQLRSQKLKDLYSINNENILTKRKFRNHIEHFDENLDKFLNDPVAGIIVPKTIFRNSDEITSITYLFKAYIVEEFKFVSLNEEIELTKLIEEVYRIYNLSVNLLEE